jgi:hypothetical protein
MHVYTFAGCTHACMDAAHPRRQHRGQLTGYYAYTHTHRGGVIKPTCLFDLCRPHLQSDGTDKIHEWESAM